MVRTLPFDPDAHVNAGRVMAFFAAMAIHVLALMMLLIPLAAPPLRPQASPPEVSIQFYPKQVPVVVVPITPSRPQPVTQPPQVPVQQTRTDTPPQVVNPVIVEGGSQAASHADSSITSDSDSGAGSGPMESSYLQYVSAPPPPYPRDALNDGAQGTVMLRVLVDTDGTPLEVSIEQSSGNRSLDRQAQRHVLKRWKFQPALRDGVPVQAYGRVPIDFSLQ